MNLQVTHCSPQTHFCSFSTGSASTNLIHASPLNPSLASVKLSSAALVAAENCSVPVTDSAWMHLHPSPGSFKLTCGASGVDHLLFQPAPVAGVVLQSIQLCPATGPSHWRPEGIPKGIPEPSCHGCAAHRAF